MLPSLPKQPSIRMVLPLTLNLKMKTPSQINFCFHSKEVIFPHGLSFFFMGGRMSKWGTTRLPGCGQDLIRDSIPIGLYGNEKLKGTFLWRKSSVQIKNSSLALPIVLCQLSIYMNGVEIQ